MKRLFLCILLLSLMVNDVYARKSVKEFYNDNKKVVNGVGIGVGIAATIGFVYMGYVFSPSLYDKLYLKCMFNKYKINCASNTTDYPKACSYIIISRKQGLKGLKNHIIFNNEMNDFKDICTQTNLVHALAEINKVEAQTIVDIYTKNIK